jgi:glycosyltransferase involved in cell wall biosynthesis
VKSVLWVTAIEPSLTAGGGGQIRQGHLLTAVMERFDVRLLLAGRLTDEHLRSGLRAVREIDAAAAPDPPRAMSRRLRQIRWEVLQRQSDEIARQREIRRGLRSALAAEARSDVVCVEYVGLAPLLPRRRDCLWAMTLHNLPSQMARHSAAIAPGARQRFMLGLEHRNSRRIEHWAARAYDLVVAVSAEDAACLPGNPVVVPNGVDTDRLQPSPVPDVPRVVFTGALHTLPNRDGVDWFCHAVWPRVRDQTPEATLDIVGSRPSAEVMALAELEGIEVHADVPDVRPYLDRARVAVVPLRIGSGSRLKALEAMAAGRPVVGTTIGLGGLDLDLGGDVLVADDEAAFADQVTRCLSDLELARGLAARARDVVERRYSWRHIGADYAALLADRVS